MNFILFENETDRDNLLPFTFTRPVASIRCGILTIAGKWEHVLQTNVSYKTREYLQSKFALKTAATNYFINGAIFPDATLVKEITGLKVNEALYAGDTLLASCVTGTDENAATCQIQSASSPARISYTYDIFSRNGQAIEDDFKLLTEGRTSR
ncbi:MAG: putative sugar nucleotidyl transferase, partial [Bacteroidota bacterium]